MFDKMELAKHGTPVPGREDIVKISEHQYVITSAPGNVIINTSRTVKTWEEHQALVDLAGKQLGDILFRQELKKRGLDIKDLY